MKLEIEVSEDMVTHMRKFVKINEHLEELEKENVSAEDLIVHDNAWSDVIDELGEELGYVFHPLYNKVKEMINIA